MNEREHLPAVRASDADRERVVAELREHCVQGRLTLEEFSERADRAYEAKMLGELEAVLRELPVESADRPRRKARAFTISIFGGSDRTGRWRVARNHLVFTLFGGADLDLRDAQIEGGEASITVLTIFGGADVYVPEGIDVDVGGFALFGGNDEHGRDLPPRPGTPLVRVRAITFFGGMDVWRVPVGTERTLRQLQRDLQKGR